MVTFSIKTNFIWLFACLIIATIVPRCLAVEDEGVFSLHVDRRGSFVRQHAHSQALEKERSDLLSRAALLVSRIRHDSSSQHQQQARPQATPSRGYRQHQRDRQEEHRAHRSQAELQPTHRKLGGHLARQHHEEHPRRARPAQLGHRHHAADRRNPDSQWENTVGEAQNELELQKSSADSDSSARDGDAGTDLDADVKPDSSPPSQDPEDLNTDANTERSDHDAAQKAEGADVTSYEFNGDPQGQRTLPKDPNTQADEDADSEKDPEEGTPPRAITESEDDEQLGGQGEATSVAAETVEALPSTKDNLARISAPIVQHAPPKPSVQHVAPPKLDVSSQPKPSVQYAAAPKLGVLSEEEEAWRKTVALPPKDPSQLPVAGEMVVERLSEQYDQMKDTLNEARFEEQGLRQAYSKRPGEQFSNAFEALAAGGIVVFLLITASALLLQANVAGIAAEHSVLAKHIPIQVVSLAWTLLATIQCVMVFPDAFGLPQTVQYHSSSWLMLLGSTFLICVSALGARRLMMKPLPQVQNRLVVFGFIVGHLLVALLHGAASDPANPWRLDSDLRSRAMTISRLGIGVCASFANIVLMMAVRVTPQESMVQFGLCRAGVTCLGAGVGALLASASICWVSVPWLVLACASVAVLPEDSGVALRGSLKSGNPDDEDLVLSPRKTLWLHAVAASLARALLSTAFQTVAAAIFVADFLFSAPEVLLAAGTSLVCGAFVVPLVVIANNAAPGIDVGRISTWAASAAALAAVLLFSPWLQLSTSFAVGLWLAFSASVLALPAVHLMGGLMEGLALQQAVPDSALNQENLVTANTVLQDGVVRLLGPPAMVFLYSVGGRSLCAFALLTLAMLACMGTLSARRALAAIDSSGSLEAKVAIGLPDGIVSKADDGVA